MSLILLLLVMWCNAPLPEVIQQLIQSFYFPLHQRAGHKLLVMNPVKYCVCTSCFTLSRDGVFFEVTVISSSRPDRSASTSSVSSVSLVRPALPPRPSPPCWSCRLPVPSQAAAWQATNQVWQVARQCHRLTTESSSCLHSFPALRSPDLNHVALNPSPPPPPPPPDIMPNTASSFFFFKDELLKQLSSQLSGFVLTCVFVLRVKFELLNNELWKETLQGVKIKAGALFKWVFTLLSAFIENGKRLLNVPWKRGCWCNSYWLWQNHNDEIKIVSICWDCDVPQQERIFTCRRCSSCGKEKSVNLIKAQRPHVDLPRCISPVLHPISSFCRDKFLCISFGFPAL